MIMKTSYKNVRILNLDAFSTLCKRGIWFVNIVRDINQQFIGLI